MRTWRESTRSRGTRCAGTRRRLQGERYDDWTTQREVSTGQDVLPLCNKTSSPLALIASRRNNAMRSKGAASNDTSIYHGKSESSESSRVAEYTHKPLKHSTNTTFYKCFFRLLRRLRFRIPALPIAAIYLPPLPRHWPLEHAHKVNHRPSLPRLQTTLEQNGEGYIRRSQ